MNMLSLCSSLLSPNIEQNTSEISPHGQSKEEKVSIFITWFVPEWWLNGSIQSLRLPIWHFSGEIFITSLIFSRCTSAAAMYCAII